MSINVKISDLKLHIPREERKVFTLSNFLSISRIILLPFIASEIKGDLSQQNNLLLLLLVLIVILTDYLDGYFARRFRQVSAVGKVLDPLADKICIGTVVVLLMLYRDFPVWLGVIIVSRDVIIIVAGILIMSKIRNVTASNIIGKITVNVLAVLILSYLFNWTALQRPFILLSVISILASLLSYGIRFVNLVLRNRTS